MEIKYDEEGYNRGVWLNHLIMLLLHTMWYEQNNKNGKYDEQIAIMMQTIYSMEAMEASPQVYRLENGAKKSKLFYDKETGEMVVRYNGLALFAHEVTHGGQFENRAIGFNENGNGYAIDIHNEVDAFKAQWAVDPATVDNLKSAKKITPKYVQNMVENGKKPYKPNGENNTAIAPINLNSTRDDIIKAYPHLKNELQTLPANVTLMTILPAIYYNGKYEKK